MEWINEDLRTGGSVRDGFGTEEDKVYIKERYDLLLHVEKKKKKFHQQTSFDIDKFLGSVSIPRMSTNS